MIGRGGAAAPGGHEATVLLFPLGGRIRAPELRELYHYWTALRAGRRMPLRRDVDPAEIAQSLPFVGLLEVQRRPLRFRYIYAGAGISAAPGGALAGRHPNDQAPGTVGEHDVALLSKVARGGVPSHIVAMVDQGGGRRLFGEYLALPLSEDGARVDLVLSGQKWELHTERPGRA